MRSILLVREDEVEDGGVVGDVRRIRALPATPAQHPVTHTQLGGAMLVLELACCGEHDEQCYDHEDGRNSQWRRIVRTKREKTGQSGNSHGSTHLVAGVDDAGSSSRLAGGCFARFPRR